jgi:hypothetical protein
MVHLFPPVQLKNGPIIHNLPLPHLWIVCAETTQLSEAHSLFGWLVANGWCWFVLREEHCWLVAGGWFVLREKYCWLVADKPSEQGDKACTRRTLSMAAAMAEVGWEQFARRKGG